MGLRVGGGKWSDELNRLNRLLEKLTVFELDVASIQGQMPSAFIDEIEEQLEYVKQTTKRRYLNKSFYDFRLADIDELFVQCYEKLKQIKPKVTLAENQAHLLVMQHKEVIDRFVAIYNPEYTSTKALLGSAAFFGKQRYTFFETRITAQMYLWMRLKAKLEVLDFDRKSTAHNVLSKILAIDDSEFIEYMENLFFPNGEFGSVALQRSRDIASSDNPCRLRALRLLRRAICEKSKEGILFYDNRALEGAIAKLVLHSLLNPDKKVIWLGTARAVEATIKHWQGDATYFNPSASTWSWELNRGWLQAAVHFGYVFKLVEQHFPDIEKAILSGDSSSFVEQLAREMRAEGVDKTSQYNGGYEPTATTQEILVLMDMGCVARKNPEDGSILFYPPMLREEPSPILKHYGSHVLQRRHSCPNLFKIASPPPLDKPIEHFSDPCLSSETPSIFSIANI